MSNVVIFDSGVGGLSIFQAVYKAQAVDDAQAFNDAQAVNHAQAVNEFIFVSDNQAFPYGTKGEPVLIERVVSVVSAIVERYAPQILVVACNTASTVVLPILRQRFDFPIVGVVPAIKPAARLSKTRHIAVLATPATIERPYTDKLIADYASDCDVLKLGSSDLVELAEKKLYGETFEPVRLESILKPVLNLSTIDILVLACTHFPLLNEELRNLFVAHDHPIQLVDSTQGIANRVSNLAKNLPYNSVARGQTKKIATFTLDVSQYATYISKLKELGFEDIQTLSVSH